MDLDNEVFDWIERYLTGEMSKEEVSHFEMLMNNDASLRSKVERQAAFTQTLTDLGERRFLKEKLDLFHSQLPVDELVEEYKPKPSIVVQLWKKHRVGLAVAASVLILAISGRLFYMNLVTIDSQSSQVRNLKRDVEKISRSQHALISKLHQNSGYAAASGSGGTGFMIDTKGYLVTNYHVVDGADSIFVQNNKGSNFKTDVIYKNEQYDLAILQIRDTTYHTLAAIPYTFRKTQPELGDEVYTLGYPRDALVYSKGNMSSETGYKGDTISYQLSIAVNPGNSGSPVLDEKGNVLGIITADETNATGVAFAVRSSYLLKALNEPKNDSIRKEITLPMKAQKSNSFARSSRVQQVKKMQDYIYMVRAYN